MAAELTRYLGVQPFKTRNKHIFFGRDEDIDNLLDVIMLEKLIVLFGKSGYGKSSLLSAGIVPRLIDPEQPDTFRFRPIEVRLGTYIEHQSTSPFETTKHFISELPTTADAAFLNTWQPEDTLWRHLKQRQGVENGQFVLIFDQFEELFSYPVEQQAAFKKQLAELLYTNIPQNLRGKLDELAPADRQFMVKPLTIKVVFAIRSDRMSFLDSMKDALPAILNKRYELRPLSKNQAKDAITMPASIVSDDFQSPPFEYTDAALERILSELATNESKGVEAFQLQIVCEEIEKTVEKGGVPDRDNNGLPDVDVENLPDFKNLYENYYRRKLTELTPSVQTAARRFQLGTRTEFFTELPPSVQTAAQRVLEDGLLAEDAATGEGRRMSVDSRALLGQFAKIGLTDAVLLDLEKTYLIRREVNTVGGFSFEISHDTLVAPIQKAKAERRAIEEKERLEREQVEKELQLAEAKRQADIERKRRRLATTLSVVSGIALVLALAAMFWAFKQQAEAVAQKDKANVATEKANLATKEANAALAVVKIAEAEKFINSAKRIQALDKDMMQQILKEADSILADAQKRDPDNKRIGALQAEVASLK